MTASKGKVITLSDCLLSQSTSMIWFIVQIFLYFEIWIVALSLLSDCCQQNSFTTTDQSERFCLYGRIFECLEVIVVIIHIIIFYGCYPTVSVLSFHNLIYLFKRYRCWRNLTLWPKTKLSTFSYSINLQVLTIVDMCTSMYQWLSVFHLQYFILIQTKIIRFSALV